MKSITLEELWDILDENVMAIERKIDGVGVFIYDNKGCHTLPINVIWNDGPDYQERPKPKPKTYGPPPIGDYRARPLRCVLVSQDAEWEDFIGQVSVSALSDRINYFTTGGTCYTNVTAEMLYPPNPGQDPGKAGEGWFGIGGDYGDAHLWGRCWYFNEDGYFVRGADGKTKVCKYFSPGLPPEYEEVRK